MKENQIDPIPFSADAQPLLPGDEGEVATQFQQKLLEAIDECILNVGLRVLVFKIEKLEDERISDVSVRRQCFILCRQGSASAGPLIGQSGDLAVELAHGPPTLQRLPLIVNASLLICYR